MIIYTALFGKYDKWVEPKRIQDCRHVLFTDQPIKSKSYEVVHMEAKHPRFIARLVKIYPFDLMKDDLFVWHDANLYQVAQIDQVIQSMKTDMLLMQHPDRNCVYREAEICYRKNKDDGEVINNQISRYKDEGYPEENGMVSTGIFIRKNTQQVRYFCRKWVDEITFGSTRDQLSFNYVRWKNPIDIDLVPYMIGDYYLRRGHNQ